MPLVTGDTWPGETEEQGNIAVLALITGVALGMGLQVMELITVPDWGLGCGRAGASWALTLLTGITWPGVTCWVEMRGLEALTLMTGVTWCGVTYWVEKQWVEATLGARFGPGSTLPESMLLPLPVLREQVGWVGRYPLSLGETCPIMAWWWV